MKAKAREGLKKGAVGNLMTGEEEEREREVPKQKDNKGNYRDKKKSELVTTDRAERKKEKRDDRWEKNIG